MSRPIFPRIWRLLVGFTLGFPAASSAQDPGCGATPDTLPIQTLGRFSDMRYTEEHAYGYSLELWRAGKCLFGLFEASEGLAGDTPAGRVSDVRYTPETGELGFTARLSTGVTMVTGSKEWVPTRDLFVFKGRMGRDAVEGKLRRSDQLRPGSTSVETDIVLPRAAVEEGFLSEAKTYGQWRERVEPILRFRGPKW